jgi:hypothetical protein
MNVPIKKECAKCEIYEMVKAIVHLDNPALVLYVESGYKKGCEKTQEVRLRSVNLN